MQRRLPIARNPVTGPCLMFICEQTGSLISPSLRNSSISCRGLVRERVLSAVIVSHDLVVVRLRADRLMVMTEGHVVAAGLTDQILDDPQLGYIQPLVSSVLRV